MRVARCAGGKSRPLGLAPPPRAEPARRFGAAPNRRRRQKPSLDQPKPQVSAHRQPCCSTAARPRGWAAARPSPPLAAAPPGLRCLSSFANGSYLALDEQPAFVSKHARLRKGELESWLRDNNLALTDPGTGWLRVRECPFCHPVKNKMDNMFKLHMEVATGNYNCFRCSAKGSFTHFKHRLQTIRKDGVDIGDDRPGKAPPVPSTGVVPEPRPEEQAKWEARLHGSEAAKSYLTATRGLRVDIAQKYGVGVSHFNFPETKDDGFGGKTKEWRPHECLSFPMYTFGGRVARQKIRGIEDKRHMRLHPKGGGWGLFGLNTIPADAKEVVLTEGEFDAMAVHQATGVPAVSLPSGASSLSPAVLPLLERFEKVYLWMDDDAAGRANQEAFARKLGLGRTVLVRSTGCTSLDSTDDHTGEAKDANDALLKRFDLSRMLKSAKHIPHQQILDLERMKDDVLLYLRDPAARAGVQYSTLPGLNDVLKGHRRGEFSVLTGATGVGKTTLLMQLSLDLASQGVNTLWGSFEISNSRLVSQMFQQYVGGLSGIDSMRFLADQQAQASPSAAPPAPMPMPMPINTTAFEDAWADFEREIPVSMMAFHGSTQVNEVVDVMRHAVYTQDVTHIILDNLQFMLSGQAAGIEKFELQEHVIATLRSFATEHSCHVTLVVHPRKEDDGAPLTTASIYGAAKVTQEADNVLILQNEFAGKPKYIDIKKNRFSGDLGQIPVFFNKDQLKFYQGSSPTAPARESSSASGDHHTEPQLTDSYQESSADDYLYEAAPELAESSFEIAGGENDSDSDSGSVPGVASDGLPLSVPVAAASETAERTARAAATPDHHDHEELELELEPEREPAVASVTPDHDGATPQEKATKGGAFHLSLSETPRHLKSVL
jgi:twinkle protein